MQKKQSLEKRREHALFIYNEAVEKMLPGPAIRSHINAENNIIHVGKKAGDAGKTIPGGSSPLNISLDEIDGIFIFAIGKAAYTMAEALLDSLGDIRGKIAGGMVITKDGYSGSSDLSPLTVREASHPVPDERGLMATAEIVEMMKSAGERDLIFFLVSGGGSALYESLYPGITIEDMQSLTKTLLSCGAEIEEINAVRKHISRVKGGKTARQAYPAQLVSLILSDVLGSPLDAIASGPTAPDTTTFAQVAGIFDKYHIEKDIPHSILDFVKRGLAGMEPETVKAGDQALERVSYFIVGDNKAMTLEAMKIAGSLGYNSMLLTNWLRGEARFAGEFFASIARQIEEGGPFPIGRPCCIIASGEPTVTIRGKGRGGRCQEAALSFALSTKGLKEPIFLAGGSDGTDGPTDAAGGITDTETINRGKKKGVDGNKSLAENDSYNYLLQTGDLIKTGPTGTNVNDLFLLLL